MGIDGTEKFSKPKTKGSGGSSDVPHDDIARSSSVHDGIQVDNSFRKDLNWLGILSAGFNVSNSWLVVAVTLTISIGYGPAVTAWGVIVVTAIFSCISITLAELVSAYPTTGGQYHWTSILAPKAVNTFTSYTCGFLSWFSWIAMSASSTSAVWPCIHALILHWNPNFSQRSWMPFLCFQGVNLLVCLFNLCGKRLFSLFYTGGFFLSLGAFFTFFITTLVMQKTKQPSSVVWTEYTQESGWSAGVQFLIGLTAPVVAFCPIDGAVHLVEEVKNARHVVPRTIITASVISFITSLAFLLATLYCITDYPAVLANTSNFPLYTIWQQVSSGDSVPVIFTLVTIVLLPIGSVGCAQVASMMTWSLGKDGGLPLGKHLSQINESLNVPVNSLILEYCVLFLIGCINLFSQQAFNSIVSVTVILQQLTIAFPTFFIIWLRRSEKALPGSRTFHPPSWVGWVANCVTLSFTVITSTFFLLPGSRSVDSSNFNYACVVVGGVFIAGMLNWFCYSKRVYQGPTNVIFYD